MSKTYYRTDKAAEMLNISVEEVRRRLGCGELIGHKSKRRHRWLIDAEQDAFTRNESQRVTYIENQADDEPIIRLIKDNEHETLLTKYLESAEKSLYIATANFKHVYINGETLVYKLNCMVLNGVDVHVICARMQTSEEKFFDYVVCPRNHMKMFIFDKKVMYIGSANITPAAIEDRTSKSKKTNNHEVGILTTDQTIIQNALSHFEDVESSDDCATCTIKDCSNNNIKNK